MAEGGKKTTESSHSHLSISGSFSSVKLVIENLGFPSALSGKTGRITGHRRRRHDRAVKSLDICAASSFACRRTCVAAADFDRERRGCSTAKVVILTRVLSNSSAGSARICSPTSEQNVCPQVTLERLRREGQQVSPRSLRCSRVQNGRVE